MDNITLYTTDCPRCKVLKVKLDNLGVKYDVCTSIDEMMNLGIISAPILRVGDKMMDFVEAIDFVNSKK